MEMDIIEKEIICRVAYSQLCDKASPNKGYQLALSLAHITRFYLIVKKFEIFDLINKG